MRNWKKLIASAFALFALADLPAHASAIGEIEMRPSSKTTYMATSAPVARAASATDMMRLPGSASKTIKVLKIYATYSVAAASAWGINHFYVIKRSTAGSGGTSTTNAGVPLDSNFAAASSAGLIDYTANPTVGTAVGTIAVIDGITCVSSSGASDSNNPAGLVLFDADKYGSAITLRGTAENICVNNNGATLTGSSPICGFIVVWTEE